MGYIDKFYKFFIAKSQEPSLYEPFPAAYRITLSKVVSKLDRKSLSVPRSNLYLMFWIGKKSLAVAGGTLILATTVLLAYLFLFPMITATPAGPPIIDIISPENVTYDTSGIPINFTISEISNITLTINVPFQNHTVVLKSELINGSYTHPDLMDITSYASTIVGINGSYSVSINATNPSGYSIQTVYFTRSFANGLYSEPISGCWQIVSSGSYYLTDDIIDSPDTIYITCISIQASDVVFDCDNHVIDGTGDDPYHQWWAGIGIYVYSNAVVKNCKITEWPWGIQSTHQHDSYLENITISNTWGSRFYDTTNMRLNNIFISSAGNWGILFDTDTNHNVLNNVTVTGCGTGLSFEFGGSNKLSNITAYGNGAGVTFRILNDGNIISDSSFKKNTYGLQLSESSRNTFTNNNFTNNTFGIYISSSSGNKIYNNILNNTNNILVPSSNSLLNTTKQLLTNIIGGSYTGGNAWFEPDGSGYSEQCSDNDFDGICDYPYSLAPVFAPTTDNIDYLPLAVSTAGIGECGNGICTFPETQINCKWDCAVCGDDICDPRLENETICYSDCGLCGSGVCASPDENYTNCCLDCMNPNRVTWWYLTNPWCSFDDRWDTYGTNVYVYAGWRNENVTLPFAINQIERFEIKAKVLCNAASGGGCRINLWNHTKNGWDLLVQFPLSGYFGEGVLSTSSGSVFKEHFNDYVVDEKITYQVYIDRQWGSSAIYDSEVKWFAICGDNICTTPYENYTNCPVDCFVCGDSICTSPHETEANCYSDCGVCGNSICTSPYENYTNCPVDCPPEKRQTIFEITGLIVEGVTDRFTAVIDSVSEATFELNWSGSDLDLILYKPDGTEINPSVAAVDPDIEYVEGATQEYYTVKTPDTGEWGMEVIAVATPPEGTEYTLKVTSLTILTISLSTDKDTYDWFGPIKMTVSILEGTTPLTGITVTADVQRPDRTDTVSLYDDGTHGDDQANDGIYSNTYTNTDIAGTYNIKALSSGTRLTGEAFTRETSKSVTVTPPLLYCGDGICSSEIGETPKTCPEDCPSPDADGDGWTIAKGDCDDTDSNIHPEADENCIHYPYGGDGIDNDCDNSIDEDCTTWPSPTWWSTLTRTYESSSEVEYIQKFSWDEEHLDAFKNMKVHYQWDLHRPDTPDVWDYWRPVLGVFCTGGAYYTNLPDPTNIWSEEVSPALQCISMMGKDEEFEVKSRDSEELKPNYNYYVKVNFLRKDPGKTIEIHTKSEYCGIVPGTCLDPWGRPSWLKPFYNYTYMSWKNVTS